MMEGSQPPLREACFHVITEADEISLEDLNCNLSSPRNEAHLGNLACVVSTDHPSERSSLDGLCNQKNLCNPQQPTDPTAPTG